MSIGHLAFGILVTAYGCDGFCATKVQNRPVDITQTLAMQMLSIEEQVRDVSPSVRAELTAALEDLANAARQSHGDGRSRTSAIAAFTAMQDALCARGYRQPLRDDGWPNTLGDAFGSSEGDQRFTTENCTKLAKQRDLDTRFLVDCDIGAEILVSAGQLLGWDFRIKNMPKHTYLEWILRDGSAVNWDWTHGASYDDAYYTHSLLKVAIAHRDYGRPLSLDEARAYYLGLIGAYAKDAKKGRELLKQAISRIPFDPLTQNNYAWSFASHPDLELPSQDVMGFALASLSSRPDDPNILDTVECLFAAKGDRAIGLSVLAKAVASGRSGSYEKHRSQVENGGICRDN